MKKLFSCFIAAAMAVAMSGITAFATDFSFDMSKAKPTYGGGQAYASYTRLDNEKRDRYNFNPLWITKDSTVEIEYTCEGEFTDAPFYLVFQSWIGDKVSATEDRWLSIAPTAYDGSKAVWTYDTLVEAWGSSNFSDVYSLVIEDNNTSITVSSFVITNVSVPKDEVEKLAGGVLMQDGEVVTVSEATEEVTTVESVEDDVESEETSVAETDVTDVVEGTSVTEISEITTEAESTNNGSLWFIICVALSVVLVIILIVIIVRTLKKHNTGWH